jgi:hypothetical protein
MRDWILGYQKAATERRPGVRQEEWNGAITDSGLAVPDELRDLYSYMNGGVLQAGVRLYPLRAPPEGTGVVEESRRQIPGLPANRFWLFGTRGKLQYLFATRREGLAEAYGTLPDAIQALPNDAWIYGLSDAQLENFKFHDSLESLLGELVPPGQTEEFGEFTYARAMSAVHVALQAFGGDKTDPGKRKALEPKPEGAPSPDDEVTPAMGARPVKAKASAAPKKPAKKAAKAKPAKAKSKPKPKPKKAAARRAKVSAKRKPAAKAAKPKKKAGAKAKRTASKRR